MQTLPESLNFLRPHKTDLIRIGNSGDGGYVVPANALDHVEYLVSIGISDDWTFEQEAARRSPAIRIDGYDRTSGSFVFVYYGIRELLLLLRGKKIKKSLSRIWKWLKLAFKFGIFWRRRHSFYRRWVVLEKESKKEIEIAAVFARVPQSSLLALKIDIEGNEYAMSKVVLEEITRRSDQIQLIVMEFHDTISSRREFLEITETISKMVPIVHIHGNNFGSIGVDGFPEVVEITFAAQKYVSEEKTSQFPHHLDSPCNPGKPDIAFSFKI
jgi:hypothetical protein